MKSFLLGLALCHKERSCPPVMPAVHMNPGCAASDPAPINMSGKAVDVGPSGWAPATMGELWTSRPLALDWPSSSDCGRWGANQQTEDLWISRDLFALQTN